MNANDRLAELAFGMAGAGFLAMTQILTLDRIDVLLQVAIYIFSFAVPALIFQGLTIPRLMGERDSNGLTRTGIKRSNWYIRSMGVGLVGIDLVVFHFGIPAGILFIITTIFLSERWLIPPADRTWQNRWSLFRSVFTGYIATQERP